MVESEQSGGCGKNWVPRKRRIDRYVGRDSRSGSGQSRVQHQLVDGDGSDVRIGREGRGGGGGGYWNP